MVYAVAFEELVPNFKTSIPIAIIIPCAYSALREWSTHLITLGLFSLVIACNRRATFRASTACVSWVDSTREDTHIIRFVLCILENAALQPECTLLVGSTALFAMLWFEVTKVLKH